MVVLKELIMISLLMFATLCITVGGTLFVGAALLKFFGDGTMVTIIVICTFVMLTYLSSIVASKILIEF